jgi:hypothetical protein
MELKRHNDFIINESKVATDEDPIGYYDICNAVMPDGLFNKLEALDIPYTHDTYSNLIEVTVKNIEEGKVVREMVLDTDVLDASDIDKDHLKYEWETEDDIGDALEIKIKQ